MIQSIKIKSISAILILLFAGTLSANNIQVSNIRLTGQNISNGYSMVQFDLSWENSWLTSSAPNNWDAAWVFVKYRITTANGGDGLWKHAYLNNNGHSGGTGTSATIDAGLLDPGSEFHSSTNPAVGVFVYRSSDGTGTFSVTGLKLRWNYGSNGVADDAMVDVKVFAIEMVYVPMGAFTVGTGGTETGSFTNGSWSSGATHPLTIASESAVTIAQASGSLWGTSTSGTSTIGPAGTLPAEWPKGYAAFYCQKYEISQQQYVDFLNTLTRTLQGNRVSAITVGRFAGSGNSHTVPQYRNGIRVMSDPGSQTSRIYGCDLNNNNIAGEANDGQWLACNYLSWMDGAAYADWAGLRPMTELEFEKACRGIVVPLASEFVWGTTTATAATGISNAGASNETPSNTGANAVYGNAGTGGPLRVGAFASGSTTRSQAGAGYYGIMELGGNLWERPVTLGNANGRAFTGVHGNGALSANGHANVAAWPGISSGEVTGATGSGVRGGDWNDAAARLYISDRFFAASTDVSRNGDGGFRGVRTPSEPPGQPDAINGLPNPCENETGLIYSVTQEPNVSYTWTVPTGWSITAGQSTHQITVDAGTVTGTIEVVPSNIWGNGPAQTLAVTLHCYPTGYVHCNPSNPTAVVDVISSTGKTWMDRNLGAAQVATSSTDAASYGDLYQWGRGADGHKCRTSANTTTVSTTDQPVHGYFILSSSGANGDWRIPQNNNLWQGVTGVNNPCPTGYRLPTDAELNSEGLSWSSSNAAGAIASQLKWPLAGHRDYYDGSISYVGSIGFYWSSTVSGSFSRSLSFNSVSVEMGTLSRAYGHSVRCIKDY